MDMARYLLDTFRFNDRMNKKLLDKMGLLPEKGKAIVLFSHLINCQFKWMARISKYPELSGMSWWDPVYAIDKLGFQWDRSLIPWIGYIESGTEEELTRELQYQGDDGGWWAASPADIALQLNYHCIHHRAQIQVIIRNQGMEPDFVDYIGTRYRKVSGPFKGA